MSSPADLERVVRQAVRQAVLDAVATQFHPRVRLSLAEAAKACGLSKQTVHKAVKDGSLVAGRIGGTGDMGVAPVELARWALGAQPARHFAAAGAEMSARDQAMSGETGGMPRTLRQIIQAQPGTLKDNTVMHEEYDPYRIDTPANRRDAQWIADQWRRLKGGKPTHTRGLHYALVTNPTAKPNGEVYLNTFFDWDWLQEGVAKARWFGFVRFEDIYDNRNAPPELPEQFPEIAPGLELLIRLGGLDCELTMPELIPSDDMPHVVQPYRLVLIGEKSSLADELRPVCAQFEAELLLPTGEISNTLIYDLAKRAWEDGRPCRVFYFSDFDPTGLNMPVVVSRKLQALCDTQFPGLDIELHRCLLTPEQVLELGLPETPMKDTEKRAGKWKKRFGCEQTEIDALLELHPGYIGNAARDALAPFFDATAQERQEAAYAEARAITQPRIDAASEVRAARLRKVQALIDKANTARLVALKAATEVFDEIVEAVEVEEVEEVEAETRGHAPDPLFTSADDWQCATQKLRNARL